MAALNTSELTVHSKMVKMMTFISVWKKEGREERKRCTQTVSAGSAPQQALCRTRPEAPSLGGTDDGPGSCAGVGDLHVPGSRAGTASLRR